MIRRTRPIMPAIARRASRGRVKKSYPRKPRDWQLLPIALTTSELRIGNWQVMQRWETPIMKTLATEVTTNSGHILEVGFGMGISAREIISNGCESYTVIEAHPEVAQHARSWADGQPVPVKVIEGFWQDIISEIPAQSYDGILFDTYPLSATERHRNHFPFIPLAPRLLRPGGVLTLYSDETLNFRREHLALLLTYFDEVKLIKITGLRPPPDCEYWQEGTMVIPVAKVKC